MNQMCKVCGEPAAGFHFGAFTCEGCKSFFGRTYNNLSSISECKNNGECVINKKNRTACKACRLRKCLLVGMSKSGSRYGRRSNWFKIHCLLQEQQQQKNGHVSINSGPGADVPPRTPESFNGANGGIYMDSGMEKNMAKYLEHFGTNMNAFRIRNNNNNNCESKYNFYDDKRLDFGKRSSSSKSDDDSNQSSSIVVDEDSQPIRDSPSLDSSNPIHHHHPHHLQLPSNHHIPLFRPGIEPISPFSQKYKDFFLSPFLHHHPSLKRRPSDSEYEAVAARDQLLDSVQDTPIDLSIKSKISRVSSGASNVNEPDRPKSSPCELEKKSPLDLTLLPPPPRCNPILG